jgi:hypothetical protein
LRQVSAVMVRGSAGSQAVASGAGLDGVMLTYNAPAELPPAPTQVQASLPRGNGIVQLSFAVPKAVYQYEIRFSKAPIQNAADFENTTANAMAISGVPYEPQKEVFRAMAVPGTYYAAVRTVDAQGLRSAPVSAPPVTVVNTAASELVTNFKSGLDANRQTWSWDGGIRLEAKPKPKNAGRKSLRLQYSKNSPWDYAMLNLETPLDVRPYRYLKIQVFGQERITAKLYTTLALQEDIGTLDSEKPDEWNELTYDLSAMNDRQIDKKKINKLLFFPAPGQHKIGEIYFGDIWLSN